jgi:hypothetical protein
MNGVIKTSTGDLLRAGFCDFSLDSTFDAGTETYRTDVPEPAKILNNGFQHHCWNGSVWVLADPSLATTKQARYVAIDEKTVELIETGWAWNGRVFSASNNSQRYWLGLKAAVELLQPSDYPLSINTLDDSETYGVVDQAELLYMFGTLFGTVKARLGAGTSLKNQIRAATTKAEVDAIVDTR